MFFLSCYTALNMKNLNKNHFSYSIDNQLVFNHLSQIIKFVRFVELGRNVFTAIHVHLCS